MSHIPHVNTLPQSGINTFLQTVSHKSCPLPSLLNNFQQRIISLLPTMKWSRITQTWQLLHGMLRVSTALKSCLFIALEATSTNAKIIQIPAQAPRLFSWKQKLGLIYIIWVLKSFGFINQKHSVWIFWSREIRAILCKFFFFEPILNKAKRL